MHLLKSLSITLCLLLTSCLIPLAAQERPKLALLFLTRNDLNFPQIWKDQLANCPDKYNVYIHPKSRIKDPFFQSYCIPKNVPTSWLRHVKGWQALIQEAYTQGYLFIRKVDKRFPEAILRQYINRHDSNKSFLKNPLKS